MKNKIQWKVYWQDSNAHKIVEVDIIPWIWEDLKKYKKEITKRKKQYIKENGHTDGKFDYDVFSWFKEELRKRLQWEFWSRCEYEIILTDLFCSIDEEEIKRLIEEYSKKDNQFKYWRNVNLKTERKVDIYEQLMLNYDVFAKYIYDSLCFVRGEYQR